MASPTPYKAPQSSNDTHSQISIVYRAMANLRDTQSPWLRCSTKPETPMNHNIPPTSPTRQLESLSDKPIDTCAIPLLTQEPPAPKTVLYLAYGSNLAAETFQGARGIKPISQLNVHVPDLELNFDLPGIPYREPCFAGTNYRKDSKESAPCNTPITPTPTTPLLPPFTNEQKWTKGLIGVVYEVTLSDYAHIIATEGGGASYIDILIRCHPIPSSSTSVSDPPTTKPLFAHTLLAPEHPSSVRKPHYAQPSARYLNLLTTGAAEHELPRDYQEYLNSMQPYTITTLRQQMGAALVVVLWLPIVGGLFAISRIFAGKDGRIPEWLANVFAVVFGAVWKSYDGVFYPVFGDGERTIKEEDQSRTITKRMRPHRSGNLWSTENDREKSGDMV